MMTTRSLLLMTALFFSLLPALAGEAIGKDFDLKVSGNSEAIEIKIAPFPDRQINGLSAEHPFVILESNELSFGEEGTIYREVYIKPGEPVSYRIPFTPPMDKVRFTLRIHYVACSISKGICDLPVQKSLEYSIDLKQGGQEAIFIILAAFFLVAVTGIVLYLKRNKNILFTLFLASAFGGILFFSFSVPLSDNRTQADLSRDIAATLCLSCLGLESNNRPLLPDPEKTATYRELPEQEEITILSAPWCLSCIPAKEYLKQLCALYPEQLRYRIVDVSLEDGKKEFSRLSEIYTFQDPLPLPAIFISSDTEEVIYGTQNLEKNLLDLIIKERNDNETWKFNF